MATFRGSGSAVNGAAFPTEAELQNAIDEAVAAQVAAEAAQAAAEVNVTESETAQAAAEAAQAAAELAIPLAHAEVVLAEQAVADAEAQVVIAQQAVTDAQAEVVLCEAQVTLATAQAVLAEQARIDAETAETGAQTAETGALAAQVAAEAALDEFDDRYLGDKASDPTLDNDGNALLTGALYWNTTTDELKVYSGTSWGGVLTETSADALYQPLDDELSDIALLAPTKGRLIAGNGSAWVDLGIGTDDHVLIADAAETVGMKWADPGIPQTYKSAPLTTWTTNTVYEFTHGLGSIPDAFSIFFQCNTADQGYVVGDRIECNPYYVYVGNWRGAQKFSTATTVGVAIRNYILAYTKTAAGTGSITNASWDIVATAIKY